MSSILELIQKCYNKGQQEFRFYLSEASQPTLRLRLSPKNWGDLDVEYFRSKKYWSCNRKGSEVDLTFLGEAREWIKHVYETIGVDANITLTVEKLNKATGAYETYPTANKVDLSVYDINEDGVSVKMVDTSFKEKVYNRASTTVDILKRISIEGFEVAPFAIDTLKMPDTSINLAGAFTDNSHGFETELIHIVPVLETAGSDFAETQTPALGSANLDKKTGSFFLESERPRTLSLDFDLQGAFEIAPTSPSVDSYVKILDESENILSILTVGQSNTVAFSFQKTINLTLNTGQSIILETTISDTDKKFNYYVAKIQINETYTGNPEVQVHAFPIYEAMLRIGQLITDSNNPFKSDFFGRTDTPLTTYPVDGEIAFIVKGAFFRDAAGTNYTIPITLNDAFDSLSAIYHVGLGIETIEGVDKIVLEDRDYFLDNHVVVDVSDQLRPESIGKRVIPELIFKSGSFGYGSYKYEADAGLFEFNTQSNWTTVIKSISTEIKKISKLRADGQGIRKLINAPYEADYDATADVDGDSDLFIVDALRDGTGFKARTSEGFTNISGSVYANSSYNIRLSPGRMIRRWGADIKAGLTKRLNSFVVWVSSDKNTTLASQFTGEPDIVGESADIRVNDLSNSKFLPEEYKVTCPITVEQLQALDANPNGIIKLSDNKYGWIVPGGSIKIKNKTGMAEMELIRVNLDVITPIE